MSPNNLLVHNSQLHAVIDFGLLVGVDPACDLAISWTYFEGESRREFRSLLPYDRGTWMRARAWTLWKNLIVAAEQIKEKQQWFQEPLRVIQDLIEDYTQTK